MKETATVVAPPPPVIGQRPPREVVHVPLPFVPDARTLWSRVFVVIGLALLLNQIDSLTILLSDYWLLQTLKLESVFWTNFSMGAKLYVAALIAFGATVAIPAFVHRVSLRTRVAAVLLALTVGMQAGYMASGDYLDFLLYGDVTFGKVDPVFGRDIGFYVADYPTYMSLLIAALFCAIVAVVASAAYAYVAGRHAVPPDSRMSRLATLVGIVSTPWTLAMLGGLGVILAWIVRLDRYSLVWKNNKDSAIYNGAQYIDVVGLFSHLNYYHLTTIVILLGTAALLLMLRRLHRAVTGRGADDWRPAVRKWASILALLILIDFGFEVVVYFREMILVSPNEPVIQLEYIRRHVDATREAYQLENLPVVEFKPSGSDDPLPPVERFLASPTMKNVPLWPGFTSYLERLIDQQHVSRILDIKGTTVSRFVEFKDTVQIYGPTQDIFNQKEKYRPYYGFTRVNWVRYTLDGEKRMLVSSVRELPLGAVQPWLTEWANRFMLFTHGWGVVMAPTGEVSPEGEPVFVSHSIPIQTKWRELETPNPRVYYGEGSEAMAFTNAVGIDEFDYPTAQERAEYRLPLDVPAGVQLDSVLKRVVLGWRAGFRGFFDIVFSSMIDENTRAHYFRPPLDRLDRVARFLYWDQQEYGVVADGKIVWLVNGVTHSDRYPYSRMEQLGDKSEDRSPSPIRLRPYVWVNYVEDSVKATVDAFTGQIRLYRISEAPVAKAWAAIYPDLFEDGAKMPASIRAQLTYPVQLFHMQFDDIYGPYYSMKNPLTFFNFEDPWDDADEVLGPVGSTGKAITFSTEPYPWIVETGGVFPAAEERVQFALSMAFTSEKALNLRAIPTVYQDGKDYGRIVLVQVPKGYFTLGTDQADAAIDQEPEVSRDFSWWTRRGSEVIRGHTSTLVIGNDVVYVEPIFLRSQQNPVTQLKRVAVVLRGEVGYGETLEEALRGAHGKVAAYQRGERRRPAAVQPTVPAGPGGGGLPGPRPPLGKGPRG